MVNQSKNEIIGGETKSLLLAIITCVAAPLFSNWLNVCFGLANSWTTEKLLVLFFSAITGHIIWDKIQRNFMICRLNKKWLDIKNAGAAEQTLWTMPSVMVTQFYDTVFGATAIIVLTIIAILILWKDRNEIRITKYTYLAISGYSVLVVAIQLIWPIEVNLREWLTIVPIIFIINIISWLFGEYTFYKVKTHRKTD